MDVALIRYERSQSEAGRLLPLGSFNFRSSAAD